ncbi:T3SS (YopN, CesT) and YbjN peptide-binding chaperone 1 [Rhodococcus coprophilus]|uniref:T3SS (YopN, CesT) and YbjN peptide-binding chaperone 1 n=1 Tax=Rhodococcus coprophilus TaxID=38310 RepID=UPI00379EF841
MTGSRTEDILLPKRRVYAAETWEEQRRDAWSSFTTWLREEIWDLEGSASITLEAELGVRTVGVEIESRSGRPARVAVPIRLLNEQELERIRTSSQWEEKPIRVSAADPSERVEFRLKSASGVFARREVSELFEKVFALPHPNGTVVRIIDHTTGRVRNHRFEHRTVPLGRETRQYSLMTESELNTAVIVQDRSELGKLVFRSLKRMFDDRVRLVRPESWEIPLGSQMVRVMVGPSYPRVLIIVPKMARPFGFAEFPERRVEMLVRTSYLRFVDDGERLSVIVDVPAHPFVPRHLDDAIGQLKDFIDRCKTEYGAGKEGRARYQTIYQGGLRKAEEKVRKEDESESIPPALAALTHLDEDGTKVLEPIRVAHVCNHDRDAILEYLRLVKEQELEWLASADEATASGDIEEAASCNHEAAAWENTYQNLRAALEVTVLPGSGVACKDCAATAGKS